jgi:ketosteroid isomerase-like protein
MKRLITASALLTSILFAGPAAAASLLDAHDRLARSMEEAGPIDGFVPHLATDVAYLHPGVEIITGRDATRLFLQSVYPSNRVARTVLHLIAAQVSSDDRVGYAVGWLEESSTEGTGPPSVGYGRFIATWRKGEGGWRVDAFMRLESSGPPAPPPPDALLIDGVPAVVRPGLPAAHALEIATADSRFADLSIAQGYSLAFPAYAADAAVLVTSGNLFWNREGVTAAMSGWSPSQTLSWYPLRAEAAASGDIGWSIGHGTFAITNGDNVQRFLSKYLTVWIRTGDGWRWLLDAGNVRPAP